MATAILLAALSAATAQEVSAPGNDWTATGVIFTPDMMQAQPHVQKLSPKVDWTPDYQDIRRLEEGLVPYLLESGAPHAEDIARDLNRYIRQYFGYTRNGQKWILTYAICDRLSGDLGSLWRELVVRIADGGWCVFSVEYNVDDSSFAELYINGPG